MFLSNNLKIMSVFPLYEEQIAFMKALAEMRPDSWKSLLLFLNYFDTPYFFFVLIPALWLGVSYQWGLRIYYWATLNSLLNVLLKVTFGWPRPSTLIASIGLFHPTSYGFPSGGAQTAMFLGVLLIYYWKSPKALPIGIVYILLISFSRLGLGVHFPIDVLGGWFFGLMLALLFIYLKNPIDQFLKNQSASFCLALSLIAPFAFATIDRTQWYFASFMFGIGIGTYYSLKNNLFLTPPKSTILALKRAVLGVILLWLFTFFWPEKGPSQSFFAALFMSIAASPIVKKLLQ
jgi:undecaprenyl-diphosphatase